MSDFLTNFRLFSMCLKIVKLSKYLNDTQILK